jgi:hypothetical protein
MECTGCGFKKPLGFMSERYSLVVAILACVVVARARFLWFANSHDEEQEEEAAECFSIEILHFLSLKPRGKPKGS